MEYQLCNLNGVLDSILVVKENQRISIPICVDNTDYQAFLKYQAEGGVVLPADDNEQTA
jgi:hypothetical protein